MGSIESFYESDHEIRALMRSWASGPRRHVDDDRALDTVGRADQARAVPVEASRSRPEAVGVFAGAAARVAITPANRP
jgi:hypothetical protein